MEPKQNVCFVRLVVCECIVVEMGKQTFPQEQIIHLQTILSTKDLMDDDLITNFWNQRERTADRQTTATKMMKPHRKSFFSNSPMQHFLSFE